MRLPEPMLAKSGPLPDGPGWRFELKLDGFRAIVSTTGGLRVRSRRGWNMTTLVPKLADLPPRLTLDGELIAFGEDGLPSFPRLCEYRLVAEGRPLSKTQDARTSPHPRQRQACAQVLQPA